MYITANKVLDDEDILNYKDGDIFDNCTFNDSLVYPHIYTSVVHIFNDDPNGKRHMKLGGQSIEAPTKFIKFYGIPTMGGLFILFKLDDTKLIPIDRSFIPKELEGLHLNLKIWSIISDIMLELPVLYERERSMYFGLKY